MDIHVPHEPVMTWKQFFVHMAIVVVGVLIAIALEQTVEWMHHLHQLHELRGALNGDGGKAMRDADSVVQSQTAVADYLHKSALAARDAAGTHRTFVLPAAPAMRFDIPNNAAWKAAKASGLVSLLPPQEVKAFGEVDMLIDSSDRSFDEAIRSRHDYLALTSQFQRDNSYDFSSATSEELLQLATLAERHRAALVTWVAMDIQLKGAEREILSGERDLDKIEHAEAEELNTLRK
jgi:hypothetical protein